MDFRDNLEVGISEDDPEMETHNRPMKALHGEEDFSGSTLGVRALRVSKEGANIEALDTSDQTREVWGKIQRWYR